MKKGWEIKKLGEVCEVLNGFAFDSSLFSDDSTHIPLIRIRDIKKGYTETFYKGSFSEDYIIKKGDYLIGMDGEFNIAEWSGINSLLNQRVCKLTVVDNKLLARYVLWFMPKALKKIEDETPFVTVKHLSSRKLLDISIPVPPISEQEHIVQELDLLSGIIEKKRQQLKELDNLSQSIFYDMFGDPITNEKGWEVKKLGEVAKLKAGKSIKTSELSEEYIDGLYPCYGGNGIRGYIQKKSHEGTLPIIGRQGALCGNVVLARNEFYATEHAVVCTPIIIVDNIWLYWALLFCKLNRFAQGVAQPGISVGVINEIYLPLPPLTLQQEFASKIEAIEKQKELIKQSLVETETLFNSRMDYYFN